MNEAGDLVVFLEPFDENRVEINAGLITEGQRLAKALRGSLSAVSLGGDETLNDLLEGYGVSRWYRIEAESLSIFHAEEITDLVIQALKPLPFRLLLFAHTDLGQDIAPRLACHFGTAAVTNCVDVRIKDGKLFYVRHLYADQLEQEISYINPTKEIVTLRPDILDKKGAKEAIPIKVEVIRIDVSRKVPKVEIIEIIPPDYRTVDIIHAKRIIGIGTGCSTPELIGQAEELSHLLKASIGTTRPVVDDGLLPKERMIGQTGKTVSPDGYLALGISGSPHHVAGIQRSKTILSVNRDPRAPIFQVSDHGFICDLRMLLPGLINRIKGLKDKR